MPSLLRTFLERFGTLDEDDWALASRTFREKTLQKGDYLLRPGEVATTANLVASGLLRIFQVSNGKESTRNLFPEGSFFAESISFFLGRPTDFFVEALEETKIFQVTKADSERLFESSMAFSRVGRKIYEWNLVGMASRIAGRVQGSGKERYLKLRKENSGLFQRVPQYIIASYLDLSPEALSRIISES